MHLPIRCRCGAAHGSLDVAPGAGMHLVCYCVDCRAFARALGRTDILDAAGGTTVFITTPARLTLTAGAQHLRCLRLSAGGMLRWYWDCCKTPLANTTHRPGVPAVSVHAACIGGDGTSLGPVVRVNARQALGPVAADAQQTMSPGTMLRIVRFLLGGLVRGAHRPNALFADGQPVSVPVVLSAAERAALRDPVAG